MSAPSPSRVWWSTRALNGAPRLELERDGARAAGYVSGATALHDQIGRVEARFNRVVVYRSRLLHSGVILRPEALSDDPRVGRLTANTFVTLERAGGAG